ncbi:VENN motif pre-toxin domain-containing protein [Xylella fastidiosa]|uniref:VENN motif pre-toxin domain-containing protein n=1 Tax=Xylella fastidiosa TaxID=2371 RepID=UPI003DA561BE
MIVNYVQQQGATAIGHWVATGQLTEGSPLHAVLHALLACAGAAASQQSCSSGAQGAAASSVLTGLFSDTRPEDTAQDREAKRNLITSIVTGIASTTHTDAATATNAAIAAVDNNWLATQQVVQMKKDISAAKNNLEMLKVIAKWGGIYTKQEVLTTVGLVNGLGEAGINDIKGMLEFLSDPVAGLKALKELIVNPEVRQQLGDSVFQELDNKIDRMQTALMVGGDEHAVQYGRDLGSLVWDIGSVAIGVGGVAKAGGVLAEAGINVSEDVLERMAARNLEKLVVQYEKYVDNAVSLSV